MAIALIFSPQGGNRAAKRALVAEVFAADGHVDAASRWSEFGLMDGEDGRCLAVLQFGALPLIVRGEPRQAGAIRNVAVARDRRGQGLFRSLFSQFLAWIDAHDPQPLLLYAAEPTLYRRFAFEVVPQHAFHGPASPCPSIRRRDLRPLDLRLAGSIRLVERLFAGRDPVSARCALGDAPDLFRDFAARDPEAVVAACSDLDTLIAFEQDGSVLRLIDVVASRMPSLASLLAWFPIAPTEVTCLFAPDKLGWTGLPIEEETGLMGRGVEPLFAGLGPFMLAPSTEF